MDIHIFTGVIFVSGTILAACMILYGILWEGVHAMEGVHAISCGTAILMILLLSAVFAHDEAVTDRLDRIEQTLNMELTGRQ